MNRILSGSLKLIEKILSEARDTAVIEQNSAQTKADEIVKKAKSKAKDIKQRAQKEALAEAKERKRRIKSVYDLEHKKDILAMKRDVLDEAFRAAIDDVASLPKDKYQELMIKLLVSCTETGKGSIKVAKNDKDRLGSDFVKKANDVLKKSVGSGEVTILEEICDKAGGFVFCDDGLEIDCSVEAVVALMREKIETDAAGILFKED